MQIDAEIVGQHELDPAHHVVRARQLAEVHEAAAGGDGAPVDAARIQPPRLVGPVGEDLEMLGGDHARAARGGVAGARADQVRRQVPVGVERGIADQAGHFGRRHGALADDDEHGIANAAVLDHPEPGRSGVDEHVAALNGRDGAGALDIGEDDALVIGGTAVERGEGGGVGAAGDGEAVHPLEGAERRRRIGIAGEAEAPAELVGPVGLDLDLRKASPARAPGVEAADEAVIGRVAGEARPREFDRRGRGGERVERGFVVWQRGCEARIDIAHGIALRRAGAVPCGIKEGLAQHHVGGEACPAVARADRVERGDDVGTRRQQVEQGLVGTVRPDRLEVAFGIEGEQLGPWFE